MDNAPMIENAEKTDVKPEGKLLIQPEAKLPAEASKIPAGCVERLLNFRDRDIIISATRDYCKSDGGHADHKHQSKLDKITKLLNLEECIEYFDMINEAYEDEIKEWMGNRKKYAIYQDYKLGLITIEEAKVQLPTFDASSSQEKPSHRQPKPTSEEQRGKERVFYIPSKLDAMIQDALRAYKFNPLVAEFNAEVCLKFGIKEEE